MERLGCRRLGDLLGATYTHTTLLLDTETISYNLDGAAGYEFTRVLDRSQDTLLRDSGWVSFSLPFSLPINGVQNFSHEWR